MATTENKLLRKLTVATAVGDKIKVLGYATLGREGEAAEGKPVPLMTVIGRVTGLKAGSVNRTLPNGEQMSSDYVKLKGNFEATNEQTGEITPNVGECILPNFVSDPIAGALRGGADSVDFAIRVDVKFKLAAATGYEFTAVSLLPIKQADSVNDIKRQLLALNNGVMPSAKMLAPPDLVAKAGTPSAITANAPTPAAEPAKPAKGKGGRAKATA